MSTRILQFSFAVAMGLLAVMAVLAIADSGAHVAWAQGGSAVLWTVRDDVATTTLNIPVSLNVLANDSVAGGNVLRGDSVGPPANGTATIIPDGTVTYTPTADFVGTDTFTYSVMVCPAGSAKPPYNWCTVITEKHGNVTIQVRPSRLYLPVIQKAGPLTQLFVNGDNTGGISRLEIWRVVDNIRVHYCENIPNDAVQHPCGAFPPGTYRVVAYTVNCGALEAQKTWPAGPVTIRVYCN